VPENFLVEKIYSSDEDLYEVMEVFYSLIDTAKKSIFYSFVKTDMSKEALKGCIKREAVFLDKMDDVYSIGLPERDLIKSLKPMYRSFKRSLRSDTEKPVFFHVNKLKQELTKKSKVSFVDESFLFRGEKLYLGDVISLYLPFVALGVRDTEEEFNCKVNEISFQKLENVIIEDDEYERITLIELKYKVKDA